MDDKDMLNMVVEVAKERSKDIYDDGLKPVTKETGEVLQTVVGLFNNVVLYPVKKANIYFRHKLDLFEKDLSNRIVNIPDDKLIEPPINVVGPLLESLKYTFDIDELRDMYLQLLASAMNADSVESCHPSYVDLIKNMSALDALILKEFNGVVSIPTAEIKFMTTDNKYYIVGMPMIFSPQLMKHEDGFLVSTSINNLCRLGLISYRRNAWITDYNYEDMKLHKYVVDRFEIISAIDTEHKLTIKLVKAVLDITDYGRNFIKICL